MKHNLVITDLDTGIKQGLKNTLYPTQLPYDLIERLETPTVSGTSLDNFATPGVEGFYPIGTSFDGIALLFSGGDKWFLDYCRLTDSSSDTDSGYVQFSAIFRPPFNCTISKAFLGNTYDGGAFMFSTAWAEASLGLSYTTDQILDFTWKVNFT
jgi:hypothetical protein